MENNPYNPYNPYDQSVAWVPQQGQTPMWQRPKEESFYENSAYYAHPADSPTGGGQQGAAKPARMSKAETLKLVDICKKFLVAASIVGFGILGGLAANHVTGVTSSQAAPSSAPSINSLGSQSPSNPDDSGGFFNQGNQGGYQFGSGNSQSPFTNSRTS